jgi:hypothetical protein
MTDARTSLAEALAVELDEDMCPSYLRIADKILARLWLDGYALLPIRDDASEPT